MSAAVSWATPRGLQLMVMKNVASFSTQSGGMCEAPRARRFGRSDSSMREAWQSQTCGQVSIHGQTGMQDRFASGPGIPGDPDANGTPKISRNVVVWLLILDFRHGGRPGGASLPACVGNALAGTDLRAVRRRMWGQRSDGTSGIWRVILVSNHGGRPGGASLPAVRRRME